MSESLLHPPKILKLLAHDLRWGILNALAVGDYRVQELVQVVDQPMNLVSYHLKQLRDGELVRTRRSEADGRDVYYSLDLNTLHRQVDGAIAALHPALSARATQIVSQMSHRSRVLFVCTHNSARSQMAEGLMRHYGEQYVDVFSAGSHPTTLHPEAIRTMTAMGIDIRQHTCKHLREFEDQAFDYVITVCDQAREVCPSFPGEGQHIHWGFADPIAIPDADQRHVVFEQTAQRLKTRIEYFLTELTSMVGD